MSVFVVWITSLIENQETVVVRGTGGTELSGRNWLYSRSWALVYRCSLICWSVVTVCQTLSAGAAEPQPDRWRLCCSTGGGDERVAFKFRARHAHWLTVTWQVTDGERPDCGCRSPDYRPVGRWGPWSLDGEGFARAAAALRSVCRQSTPSREPYRVTRHVMAGILISWTGGPAAEARRTDEGCCDDDVSPLHSTTRPDIDVTPRTDQPCKSARRNGRGECHRIMNDVVIRRATLY